MSRPPSQKLRSCLSSGSPTEHTEKTSSNAARGSKEVNFDSIQIREYNVTLGDHPSTCGGPPVTLDWDHLREHEISVEAAEKAMSERHLRTGTELRMPAHIREEILGEDFSKKDIFRAQMECRKVQNQRLHSQALQDVEHIEVAFSSVFRKIRKWHRRNVELTPAEEWLKTNKKEFQEKFQKQKMAYRKTQSMHTTSRAKKTAEDLESVPRVELMRRKSMGDLGGGP